MNCKLLNIIFLFLLIHMTHVCSMESKDVIYHRIIRDDGSKSEYMFSS